MRRYIDVTQWIVLSSSHLLSWNDDDDDYDPCVQSSHTHTCVTTSQGRNAVISDGATHTPGVPIIRDREGVRSVWEPVLVVILYKDRSQERHLNKYHMTLSGKRHSHIQVTFSKIKLHLFPGTEGGGLFVLMQYYSAQVARTFSAWAW